MVEIKSTYYPYATSDMDKLKEITGATNVKDAIDDAIEYRIKHGGKKA